MRRSMLFALGFLAFGTMMAPGTRDALAQSAKTQLTDPDQAHLFNDISDRLVCQCGCQMVLKVCNHQNCPSAIPMRREIERKIVGGVPADSIVASFREEHGLKVLSSPPAEGINLAVWIMPGFAGIIGLLLIIHFAGHWAARRKLAAADSPEIDDDIRRRIEEDLKDMRK